MRYILLAVVLSIASCAPKLSQEPPLQYSYLPDYLDLDSVGVILPQNPETVVDSTFQDFRSIAIYKGSVYTGEDTVPVASGVVFSPKKAAKYIFYEAEYKRMKVELKYAKHLMKKQYNAGAAAEKLYQNEIIEQRKKAKRSWLERNSPYLGFLAGIATAILTELAVIKIAD